MTEKQLNKRMKALTNLAHYSTQITLKLATEFLEDNVGFEFNFTEELQDSLNCLLKDGRNDVIVTSDGEETLIDIRVKE